MWEIAHCASLAENLGLVRRSRRRTRFPTGLGSHYRPTHPCRPRRSGCHADRWPTRPVGPLHRCVLDPAASTGSAVLWSYPSGPSSGSTGKLLTRPPRAPPTLDRSPHHKVAPGPSPHGFSSAARPTLTASRGQDIVYPQPARSRAAAEVLAATTARQAGNSSHQSLRGPPCVGWIRGLLRRLRGPISR